MWRLISKQIIGLLMLQAILGFQYIFAHTLEGVGLPKIEERFMIVGHEGDGSFEPDSVWIVNLSDYSLVTKIFTGDRQVGMDMTPDHRYAYVANENSHFVSVIDLIARKNIANVKVGNSPHELIVSSDGKEVYVANSGDTFLSIIDVSRNKVIKEIELGVKPLHVAIDPKGNVYMIPAGGSHTILVLDHTTKQIINSIYLGEVQPSNIWFSSDGSLVYITAKLSDSVYAVETSSKNILEVIPVGNEPTFITSSPNENYLYVSNSGEDTISVINLISKTSQKIVVGPRPLHIEFSPDGKYAYTAVNGADYVSIIDTEDLHVVGKFDIDSKPHAIHLFEPHNVVLSPLEFFIALAGIMIGVGFTSFYIKRNNRNRDKIVIILLVSSAAIGIYLALIDEIMWLVAPSHGYVLAGIIGVNITLVGLMKFNKRLAILCAFIFSIISTVSMISDLFTYKDVGLAFKEMLEHLYLQWPFNALLVTQILIAITSWSIIKQHQVLKSVFSN